MHRSVSMIFFALSIYYVYLLPSDICIMLTIVLNSSRHCRPLLAYMKPNFVYLFVVFPSYQIGYPVMTDVMICITDHCLIRSSPIQAARGSLPSVDLRLAVELLARYISG